jgi:hypothetical protein
MNMIGGMKKTASRLALVAGASVLATSAMAADLGGDCCADLEERIAELEATTVRKGNRVVSLTLYGQVNRAMHWHDDDIFGTEREGKTTFADNEGRSGSRFGMRGSGSLSSDVSIGYRIELTIDGNRAGGSTRRPGTGVRLANVYVDSKMYGRVTIGQQSTATDGIAEIALGSYFTPFGSENDGAVSGHAGIVTPGVDGGRAEGIRYTSPVLAGFTVSAFYGQAATFRDEEDYWDVALRYANEFNGVRLAWGIGYSENEVGTNAEVSTLATSGSILHVPTGLFFNAGYASVEDDRAFAVTAATLPTGPGVVGLPVNVGANTGTIGFTGFDFDFWNVGAGITGKWSSLGSTTFAGDFGMVSYDGLSNFTAGAVGDDGRYFGFGLVQNIDATATDIYLSYRNYKLDNNLGIDSVNVVTAGMRVKF